MAKEQVTAKHQKFIGLLKELFQLNQPDLDFGFYRVMHAKSAEVTQFLVEPGCTPKSGKGAI